MKTLSVLYQVFAVQIMPVLNATAQVTVQMKLILVMKTIIVWHQCKIAKLMGVQIYRTHIAQLRIVELHFYVLNVMDLMVLQMLAALEGMCVYMVLAHRIALILLFLVIWTFLFAVLLLHVFNAN
jgi:hypothetical protein